MAISPKEELTEAEKVFAMVSFALGLVAPDNESFWDMEGIDNSTLSDEEKAFITKVRKDQWSSSISGIMGTLQKAGLMTTDVQEEGFKYGVAQGLLQSDEEKDNE